MGGAPSITGPFFASLTARRWNNLKEDGLMGQTPPQSRRPRSSCHPLDRQQLGGSHMPPQESNAMIETIHKLTTIISSSYEMMKQSEACRRWINLFNLIAQISSQTWCSLRSQDCWSLWSQQSLICKVASSTSSPGKISGGNHSTSGPKRTCPKPRGSWASSFGEPTNVYPS